jgi:hypothetical protein
MSLIPEKDQAILESLINAKSKEEFLVAIATQFPTLSVEARLRLDEEITHTASSYKKFIQSIKDCIRPEEVAEYDNLLASIEKASQHTFTLLQTNLNLLGLSKDYNLTNTIDKLGILVTDISLSNLIALYAYVVQLCNLYIQHCDG